MNRSHLYVEHCREQNAGNQQRQRQRREQRLGHRARDGYRVLGGLGRKRAGLVRRQEQAVQRQRQLKMEDLNKFEEKGW